MKLEQLEIRPESRKGHAPSTGRVKGGPVKKHKLTWKQLDACASADAVAELLQRHRIKGVRHYVSECPLAMATGYLVGAGLRWKDLSLKGRDLTLAEDGFVKAFDRGEYPSLELKEEPE